MDAHTYFDATGYFAALTGANRLAREAGFKFCTCSGIESLQGPLELFKRERAFVCLDDTNDGALFQGRGGGWYKKRTFTVFLLHRHPLGDEGARAAALGLCRRLFDQLMSRMLVDADRLGGELVYLHADNVLSRELGQYFLNGCTGLYFMVDVSEPVDLSYNPEQWTD